MNIRQPVYAGRFYQSSPSSCRRHVEKLIDSCNLGDDLPEVLYGGLVPHAGWVFSGQIAMKTFQALARSGPMESLVIFGADHVGTATKGEVCESGVWRTPLGEVGIDEALATAVIDQGELFQANCAAHAREHSIEVQLPLLQGVAPDCRIVPIAVPPLGHAVEIGTTVGKVIAESFPNARVLCSSDLTHHGGHFGSPGGEGEAGEQWSRENDRRMLSLMEKMDAEAILPEARAHRNACGAGAITAAVAATRRLGATRGICLEYTNSYVVTHELYPGHMDDTTVGYASVVFA